LTDKGQPNKDAQSPADVEFLNDGTWGILHYGGRREAGKYRVQGERLIMLTDDGETYNDARMDLVARRASLGTRLGHRPDAASGAGNIEALNHHGRRLGR
jgi:hypothetical protein